MTSDPAASLARMNVLTVMLRREILKRTGGDSVIHWVAMSETPRLRAQGRSIATVMRVFRARIASSVSFVFELVGASRETRDAIDVQRRAAAEVRRAQDALELATCDAIRVLLVGTPAVSVRDAARILGVPKSLVQRIATERTAAARKRAKSLEREASLQTSRNAAYLRYKLIARDQSRTRTTEDRR